MGTPPNVPHERTSGRESRPTTVLRTFRRLLAGLEGLQTAVNSLGYEVSKLIQVQKEQGPSVERLEALELSRHQFEAMCEGLLQKAEGKLRAANNAEARERANKKSYEHLLDPLAEDGEQSPAPDSHFGNDAPAGEAERLQALRLDVAPTNPKTLAQRAKFGVR